jgi:Uma2 family endonuclease
MTTINTHSFTPDDVLRLESQGELYELVAGQLVEKPMSELANETAGLICAALIAHARPRNLGRVLPEQTFKCFPNDPDQIRRPDVAFISADHASDERSAGHIPFPPDLAVEVISPNDKAYDLDEKLNDYRQARIKLVWVVNPELRTVVIERVDGSISRLTQSQTITGEGVLPGFSATVADLLPAVAGKSK